MFRIALAGDEYPLSMRVGAKILGDTCANRDEIADFWADVCGDVDDARIHDDDFIKGFVDGAYEVYEAVAGQV